MKTAKILFLVLLLGIAAFIGANWQLFQDNMQPLVYRRGPAMTATLDRFSDSMDEAAILRTSGIPLTCVSEASVPSLGDRVCYSNIRSYGDVMALRAAFFLKDGHLASIKIDVPGWLHKKMGQQLIKQFGSPRGAQDVPAMGVRLVGWKLEQGAVLYNRDPEQNPLVWNTIQWLGETESERLGGVFIRADKQAVNSQ